MAKLYPPVIEGTIPAFNGTELTVPFSMNRSVNREEISGFALKVKTVQSNTWLATITGSWGADGASAHFTNFGNWHPVYGQYYKVQLAYISDGVTGYFSTVGVVKYTEITIQDVKLLAGGVDLLENPSDITSFKYTYTGVLDYTKDPMEKIYDYQFCIYNEAEELIYDSGKLLHNANNDTSHTSVDSYTFLDDLDEDAIFYLQYRATTVNGLQLVTPKVMIMMAQELVTPTDIDLTATNNYDNGYVQLTIQGGTDNNNIEKYVSGKFKIYRQDLEHPKRWEPIFSFVLQSEQPSSYGKLKDFTVEHNKTYKYKLCQFNDNNILATITRSNEVYVDFEDMFLFDGERQLKVQFNPKVSSFKNDILESKIDTIGSKYPFFFRNGHVHYKEFPISGLISYWEDDEGLFVPINELGLVDVTNYARSKTQASEILPTNYKTKDLVNYNLAAERKFKLNALEWLTNGQPKLFRSPTEGNYIVRLMNTTLTPNDTVGRMLHTFNCTAYEIDDCNYSNLGSYGFIGGETLSNNTSRLRFRTVVLADLVAIGENSIYLKDDGYIEVLVNPYGAHNTVLAQSIKIEDCEYGDKFLINGKEIMIGATQSYNIDNTFQINSVQFKPEDIAALSGSANDGLVLGNPIITYSYYDTFNGTALFDKITDITLSSVPSKQFIRTGNDVYNNLINEIENIKTKVTKYNYLLFEKRPIEEIYTIIDLTTSSGHGDYSKMFFQDGFKDDKLIDSLFTFDKTGWGRGRSGGNGTISRTENIVSGDSARPSQVIKNMPFYLFKVLPTTVLASEVATQLRVYFAKIRLAAERLNKNITKEDVLGKNEEEILELFGVTESSNPLTSDEREAITKFKNLQEKNGNLTVGGFISGRTERYIPTSDTERKEDKTYYIMTNSFTQSNNVYSSYIVYDGDLPNPNVIIYEYGDVEIAVDDELKDLYINFDTDDPNQPNYYNKAYYFYYTKDENGKDTFKIFDGGRYSTKVYINTGHVSGFDINDEEFADKSIDLADTVQPVLYKNIEGITDIYIGNGVLATLGYQYSTTTYDFEQEQEIFTLKRNYEDSVTNYKNAIAGYVYEASDSELSSAYRPDPANTYEPIIKENYKKYITALEKRIQQWGKENEVDNV